MSGADTGDVETDISTTDGGNVLWGNLARVIAGIGLSVVGYAVASWIGLLRDAVTGAIDGIGRWYTRLVGAPFNTGTEEITQAAEAGVSALSDFGPFAFPVAVVIAAVMILLIIWGVNRFV